LFSIKSYNVPLNLVIFLDNFQSRNCIEGNMPEIIQRVPHSSVYDGGVTSDSSSVISEKLSSGLDVEKIQDDVERNDAGVIGSNEELTIVVDGPPDGGLEAWTVVLGAWCCSFCCFGWMNSKYLPTQP
jgi:hypothetical protein